MDKGQEVVERLRAGATVTQTRDPFFLKKGIDTIADIKSEIVDILKQEDVKDINQFKKDQTKQ